MSSSGLQFGGFAPDDGVPPPSDSGGSAVRLSPYGLLVRELGVAVGRRVYQQLADEAQKLADLHGGTPVISFEVDGGKFAAVLPPHAE